MNTDFFRRVQDTFDRIAALPPSRREEAIVRECGGDDSLASEVRSLLKHASPPGDFLELSALAPQGFEPDQDLLEGRTFGAYHIERRIASGGMGTVYAAERTFGESSDTVAQRVAFKVVKRGMDSEEIIRRFRQERRTLARLSHPAIASLLDGGVLPDGRPFLVMEFVVGVPIDQACRERFLDVPARLRLFREVCRAVHFAHQNLVIHRDLKPGNILITPDGLPKLLDFGIAKVLLPGETGAHGATEADERRLTPEYASPEQISGETVTTASDVYSLGVILYLLLSGRRPYEFNDRTAQAVERLVREADPPPPSAAAGLSPTLARTLRGDLDNIVARAMEKTPARRYASAEQLADDIDRYLGGLPVTARPPSLGYHAAKFIRRHAAASASAAVAVLGLIAIITVIAVQNRRIRQERDEANTARDQQELVTEIMREALSAGDVDQDGAGVTVSRVMDRLLREKLPGMSRVPRVRATLRHTIGLVSVRNGDITGGEALIHESLNERLALLGPDHHDVGESRMGLGEIAFMKGDFESAERAFRDALRIYRLVDPRPSEDQAQALNDLGVTVRALGRYEEAGRLLEESLALRATLPEPDPLRTAETHNNLSRVYANLDRFPEAFASMETARALREKHLPPGHTLILQTMNNIASLSISTGDYARAEELLLRVIPAESKALGATHPRHAGTLANLGRVYLETGRYELAESVYRNALAIRAEKLPPDSPALFATRLGLVSSLIGQKNFQEAEAILTEAAAAAEPLRPDQRDALHDTGVSLYSAWGRPAEAESWKNR